MKTVEAEGSELVLKNKKGMIVIIPEKYRTEVLDMIKTGCNSCIDELVKTLPKENNYAQEGSIINPDEPIAPSIIPRINLNQNQGKISLRVEDQPSIEPEIPTWKKYQQEYQKRNPLKQEDITNYVNERFSNPVGREVIEKIDSKRFKEKLRLEYLDKYSNQAMDYITKKLKETNPSFRAYENKAISRAELLNSLSEEEEAIIKRDPRYRSTIWNEAMLNLKSAFAPNSMTTILQSKDYSEREKKEMIQSYIENPFLRKLYEVSSAMSPLIIPGKVVQAIYKEDYTVEDALKGIENNATLLEDLVVDPLTFIPFLKFPKGLSKVGDMTKLAKSQINIKKTTSRDFTKAIYKQHQLKKIYKYTDEYLKRINAPDVADKIKAFDKTYGTNLDKNIEIVIREFSERKKEIIIPMYDKSTLELGRAKVNVKGRKLKLIGKNLGIEDKSFLIFFGEPTEHIIVNLAFPEHLKSTIWHEMAHTINTLELEKSPKFVETLDKMFYNLDELTKPDEVEKYLLRNKKEFKKLERKHARESILKGVKLAIEYEYNYIKNPTEFWSFLSTNLRQDLVDSKIFKSYNDILTKEKLYKLDKLGNKSDSWFRFSSFIKDKDLFIKVFNEMTLTLAPIVAYIDIMSTKAALDTLGVKPENKPENNPENK